MDNTSPQPWTQQPGERAEAFEAFRIYRDAGSDRSTARVAQQCGKQKTQIDRWCSRWGWVRRVGAYDRHLDALRRQEHEDQLVELSRRQGVQLAAAAQALTQPVRALLERIETSRAAGDDPFEKMSTAELGRLALLSTRHLPAIVEAERLVAGLSTVNIDPDASASVGEARRRAETMNRDELETFLLGVDDGRRELLREAGLDGAGRPWPPDEDCT